ncbi:related to alkaline ceramidase [Ramularia collo-cygni]|uniref:Related to alkaline ceramidase n=1 Tax=Ramularia collo-cygni TaxID=112498 RepID=A0A2D3VQK9_9PEZI|nr:related to alkaline ceramidase [Ramularia collo-cygni]CZT24438.1 related to alkaline ceramidase [Ramularia collo-cygni]
MLSIPYPPASPDGYWHPHTSTIDWCEENYWLTRYIAEVVNSFTNLIFVYLAIVGMHNCYKHQHDRIFLITFFGYAIVGFGSFAFHATLKYPMQLVDELSMIYTTCLMVWATFEHKRPMLFKVVLAISIAGLALFITLYYHYLQDPTFHQNAYAILTAIVLIRSMVLQELHIRPYFRGKASESGSIDKSKLSPQEAQKEERRRDERDRSILRRMWTLVAMGLGIFLTGFAIWSLDNNHCNKIRGWRKELGLPWGVLLEGHGIWHLFTGVGAYCYIVWGIWLRHCLNGKADEYELHWPSIFWTVPRIVRTQVSHAKRTD